MNFVHGCVRRQLHCATIVLNVLKREELIEVTNRNYLYRLQARYLVERQDEVEDWHNNSNQVSKAHRTKRMAPV